MLTGKARDAECVDKRDRKRQKSTFISARKAYEYKSIEEKEVRKVFQNSDSIEERPR